MPQTACPSRGDLVAYKQGDLPDDTDVVIETHLEAGCPTCIQALADLEGEDASILDHFRNLPPFVVPSDASHERPVVGVPVAAGAEARPLLAAKYEILEQIGEGGMGVVNRARDVRLNRNVAIKMIRSGKAAELRQRFTQEAHSLAGLEHPNIVRLYEYGEHEEQLFFAMEFVDGGTSLHKQLDAKPLPPVQAALHAETLVRAVHYAHTKRVIHRDLKPANILVAPDGTLKIADFGIAKHLDADTGQTGTAVVMGTVNYMSPEQASGQAKDVTFAADVYSLGATLYEMLTGQPPFKGSTALEVLDQVRNREPLAPRLLQPKCPRDLETICLKCLEKEPKKRYASAGDLADDLCRYRRGEPIHARPPNFLERGAKWARRCPGAAALIAVSVALIAVSVSAVASIIAILLYSNDELNAKNITISDNNITISDKERIARTNLYLQSVGRANAELRNNRLDLMRTALDNAPSDLRQWEWRYLDRLCSGQATVIGDALAEAGIVVCSPDSRYVATLDGKTIRVFDANTGEFVRSSPGQHCAFHAERTCLTIFRDPNHNSAELFVWDFLSDEHRLPLHLPPKEPGNLVVAFAPDAKRVAIGNQDGSIEIWDLQKRCRENPNIYRHATEVRLLAFSPDGKKLASAGKDRTICIWDLDMEKSVLQFDGHERSPAYLCFHPTQPWIASGSVTISGLSPPPNPTRAPIDNRQDNRSDIQVWDTLFGKSIYKLPSRGGIPQSGSFSPDGCLLATGGSDGNVEVWQVNPDSGEPAFDRIRRCPTGVTGLGFCSPTTLFTAASVVQRWDLKRLPEPVVYSGIRRGVYFSTAVRRNDDIVALGSGKSGWIQLRGSDGRLRHEWNGHDELVFTSVDCATVLLGGIRLAWADPDAFVFALAFSPDGSLLASGGRTKSIKLWKVTEDGTQTRLLRDLDGFKKDVRCLAFHPAGNLLAAACTDGNVYVWDINDTVAKPRWTGGGHKSAIAVVFAEDGKWLATADEPQRIVHVWDTPGITSGAKLTEKRSIKDFKSGVKALAVSRHGQLAVGLEGEIQICDPMTGDFLARCQGHAGNVVSVAFHPDGKRLASASHDKTVRLWDTETGAEVLTMADHPGAVSGVAFGGDGSRLFGAGWHETLVIWDSTRR